MPVSGKRRRTYLRDKQKTEGVFTVRLRRETRSALEKLAAQSGRTLGGEIEASIESAFAVAGNKSPTFAIMLLITQCIDGLVALRPEGFAPKAESGGWLHDRYLHEQAKQVVVTMFDLFRPPPSDWQPEPNSPETRQGKSFAVASILELQHANLRKPKTAHQRWLAFVRANLDEFLDRPVIGGITRGERARISAIHKDPQFIAIKAKLDAKQPITPEEAETWKGFFRELNKNQQEQDR